MCGPPIDVIISGITRNGPTPTIPMMFVAVAGRRPMPRLRVPCSTLSVMLSPALVGACVPGLQQYVAETRGQGLVADEGIQSERLDRLVPRSAECRGNSGALVGLHLIEHPAHALGRCADMQRVRAVRIHQARHFDDIIVAQATDV